MLSLRARLVALLFVLLVVAIVATNLVAYVSLRAFLLDRASQDLERIALLAGQTMLRSGTNAPDLKVLSYMNALPPEIYASLRDSVGREVVSRPATNKGEPVAPPDLPATLPGNYAAVAEATGDALAMTRLSLSSSDGGSQYDAIVAFGADGRAAIVAISLAAVSDTLAQLLRIEVTATVIVAIVVAAATMLVVRVGLRPLSRMEHTAEQVAEGGLGRRVSPADRRTEVGRLGLALNAMLDRIEDAFRARETSEATLRRFVADASHELRTPLASIRGYAELFGRGAADRPADLGRAMRGIEDEAERMGRIVADLLLLARLDEGRVSEELPVDLSRVAREAVEGARVIDTTRPVSLDASEPVWVVGDEGQLRQAIDNLLSNVRIHTPPETQTHVSVRQEDGTATIEVADNGPGMTHALRDRAFERFYRGERSGPQSCAGSGLGLAIVSAIATAHRGHASIEARATAGTRVRLDMPVSRGLDH